MAGDEHFQAFMLTAEPRLRHAFVARYGPEIGREVAAEALAYAWEHWDRVSGMENPTGYLYRVGQSRARRYRRQARPFLAPIAAHEARFEPALVESLERLSERQRTVVLLVHGYGWLLTEVAEILGISLTTAQKHEERALDKLRKALEVTVDA